MDRIVLAAARELSHLGVTANVVNPGATETGWITPGTARRDRRRDARRSGRDADRRRQPRGVPLFGRGRLGERSAAALGWGSERLTLTDQVLGGSEVLAELLRGAVRIAISTGGGDAPGLNSVIRAATLAACGAGWEVVGIRDGFNGLMFPELYPDDGGTITLTRDSCAASGISAAPCWAAPIGAIPPTFPVQQADGSWVNVDRTDELVGLFREAGIDALITIGGDGSLTIGRQLSDAGMRVIGVPKTIDNDLEMTDATFGFDTAVEVATECIDRLFTTATSHSRVFVVEVMGRYAGWIALNSGMAAGAHAILIPEIPFDLEPVAEMIARREARGAAVRHRGRGRGRHAPRGERSVIGQSVGQAERLGGIGVVRRQRARAAHRQGGPHRGAGSSPARRNARRRSIGCSACGSAPPRCAVSRRATAA